jgi:hypothetical protein
LNGRFSERAKLARNPFSTIKLADEAAAKSPAWGIKSRKIRIGDREFTAPEAIIGAIG